MKKVLTILPFLFFLVSTLSAQLLTWSPDFAKDNDNITITLDATKGNQGLLNHVGNVYVHVGVITNLSTGAADWKYVKFSWGIADPQALAPSVGTNKWAYTINNVRSFFGVPAGEQIRKIAVLFRSGNCNSDCKVHRNSDGSDMYVPLYDANLAVRFNQPFTEPRFVPVPESVNRQVGDAVNMVAVANKTSAMKLYLNGTQIQSASGVTTISANPTLTASGTNVLVAEANDGITTKTDTMRLFVASTVNIAALPSGVRDGINYEPGDTSVTLVLYAPNKARVGVLGDFPGGGWAEQAPFQFNKTPDGNYWWKRITGLIPGTEYSFQYIVNGTLRIADPYCEKILDPFNDPFITSATYPGLKPYPTGLTTGLVGLIQTASPAYAWSAGSFSRPDKRNLMIYEMLMRDFTAAQNWNTLRDTLNYLKNLGINAIEIMPFNEFEGNQSWGYNPSFFLAPDKYYGPKNTLKRFIDSCHKKGIAVIMDIALNHAFDQSPLVQLYYNSTTNQTAADNPWFNPNATHPFNVGRDFNHESMATRYYTSRVIEHWLKEYRIDGFRWDLSKGFTQVNSGSDVGIWSQYDASRVAIWKRYYDTMMAKSPGSYCILEHFAANNEEKELSDYGMLLWGNMNNNYGEAAMGYLGNSNFEGGIFTVRTWTKPHLITYMESHDEERLMYKNLQFGNSNANYNTKMLDTALRRMEMNAAFLYTIPGPKMLWQFGELGYDYSINYCTNGTVNPNCRLDPKPIRWDYLGNARRKRVYDVQSALMKLRYHPAFTAAFVSDRIGRNLSGGFKWLQVTTDTSNICVIGNFDIVPVTGTVTFQNAGTWYDYLNGNAPFTATGTPQNITLQPGQYHVYLNRIVNTSGATPIIDLGGVNNLLKVNVFPNPVQKASVVELDLPETGKLSVELWNASGQLMQTLYDGLLVKGKHRLPMLKAVDALPAGLYFIRVKTKGKTGTQPVIIN